MSQYKWTNVDQIHEKPLDTLTKKNRNKIHIHKHARENQDKRNKLSNKMPQHILYT